MSRIAYVNGRYCRHGDATVSIDDRGLQFGDGVYEVIAVVDGRLVDTTPHMARLKRSLAALDLAMPMSERALESILFEVARRNGVHEGIVYLQIDRGVAPRDHAFPVASAASLIVTARRAKPASGAALEEGVDVITAPDIRWRRRDIKSIALLPNVLAKQKASAAAAFETWQIDDDGFVTEGAQSNAWIVTGDGTLVTRPASDDILNGITRVRLLAIARRDGLAVDLRPFTIEEAQSAREAFLTSTSSFVVPVNRIDGKAVANGRPGSITESLRAAYIASIKDPNAALDVVFDQPL